MATNYNIVNDPGGVTPALTLTDWAAQYGENNIEYRHDQSMLTLCTPEDSLAFVGPPRMMGFGSTGMDFDSDYRIIGFMNNLTYSESAQIQPLKAIGSRRHIFSKTNVPVQGSISRLVILGTNLFRLLYGVTEDNWMDEVTRKRHGNFSNGKDLSYYNLEEDVYRIPFGLGIIYSAPGLNAANGFAQLTNQKVISAEYIESCVITSRRISLNIGQGMVMEDVSFIADRVMPFPTYGIGAIGLDKTNPLDELI